MKLGFRVSSSVQLGLVCTLLATAHARAQDPAPAPAPQAAEPVVNPPPAQDPSAPPPITPPVATPPVEAPPPEPPVTPPPPAPPVEEPAADDLGPLNLAVWARADLGLSTTSSSAPGNFPSGDSPDDVYSTGEFWLLSSAKVHKYVRLTANFASSYNNGSTGGGGITSSLSLLDGIIQLEPSEFFNVWIGRHLVPVDRSNFSGPFFMAPWYYPGFGFADGQVAAPREGPYGRNDGATVWGQFGGGLFKYYVGAFDLHDPSQSPLISGRVSLHLLNPEPGFYGSSTFFGKDLLGIGLGFQSKKDGSGGSAVTLPDGTVVPAPTPDDYTGFNVDVLFEKDLGAAGVLDLEGAFYTFNGDNERTESMWFALASYILPVDVAGGKLQPLLRVQQAMPQADGADTSTLIDAQVSYIVNSYATRFTAGFRTGSAGDAEVQALFLGAQVQK